VLRRLRWLGLVGVVGRALDGTGCKTGRLGLLGGGFWILLCLPCVPIFRLSIPVFKLFFLLLFFFLEDNISKSKHLYFSVQFFFLFVFPCPTTGLEVLLIYLCM
jgi:hypothetical protein